MKNSDIYHTLALGPFARERLRIVWDRTFQEVPVEVQKAVNSHWQSIKAPHLFNGPLVRLDDFETGKGKLILRLGRTDYATLMYSNSFVDRIVSRYGENYLSRALGISAVLVSGDGLIVLIRRSQDVGEYPGCLDIPGGHIDVPENDECPDLFSAMNNELEEEIGLSASECQLELIGLVEVAAHKKPELIFAAGSVCSSKKIMERAQSAQDKKEWQELIPLHADELKDFLLSNKKDVSPSAYAGLELYYHKTKR